MPRADAPVISLFSGAMGLDLGLERAGVMPSLAIEFDQLCCSTIKRNRPDHQLIQADVSTLTAKDILKVHGNPKDVFLMIGGPPCQSFSSGGKRAALSDPRGNLVYVYLKLINEIRPQFFVLENVANIVTAALRHRPIAERPGKNWNLSSYDAGQGRRGSHDEAAPMAPDELSGSAIKQIISDVTQLGYQVSFSVVDSSDYGAPQKRLRFIMLGSRDGLAPEMCHETHGERSEDQSPVNTVRDAIYDLRRNPGPHSEYTPEVARFFAMVPPGGNWRDLPKPLQRKALGEATHAAGGGKTGFFRRLSWGRPSPTITGRANRKGSALCHPEAVRPISVRECARLQGFPDEWDFCGSMNRQYLQVGNAVPVQLGEAIGKSILAASRRRRRSSDGAGHDVDLMLAKAIKRLRDAARNNRSKDDKQRCLF